MSTSTSSSAAQAAPARNSSSSSTPNVLNTGGAWEAILDKATTQVTDYLASTTRPFDPSALLSGHMLNLIDRGTLRDILVERNYNELCGCVGCGNKPRGLLCNAERGPGTTLTFEWSSSSSSNSSFASSCSESDDAEGETTQTDVDAAQHGEVDSETSAQDLEKKSIKKVRAAKKTSMSRHATEALAATAEHTAAAPAARPEDEEEIVYEDDLYTAESFRLAQRQRAVLNRMEKKKHERLRKLMASQQQQQSASSSAARNAAAAGSGSGSGGGVVRSVVAPRVRRSGLLGASFPQRFCSPECVEAFESDLMPRVSPYQQQDYPVVFSAITNLFPNLSVASLQQLAGAEVSASWLVKPIQEKTFVDTVASGTPGTTTTKKRATTKPSDAGTGNKTDDAASGNGVATAAAAAPLRPVQVGVSYESNAHLSRAAGTKKKVRFSDPQQRVECQQDQQPQPPLLRSVLEQMHVLQGVWNNEVVPRFSDTHVPRVAPLTHDTSAAAAAASKNTTTGANTIVSASTLPKSNASPDGFTATTTKTDLFLSKAQPRPTLRGALLLFDFILNVSGAKTRRLFRAHFLKQRAELHMSMARFNATTPTASSSFFYAVSAAVITAMEARYGKHSSNNRGSSSTSPHPMTTEKDTTTDVLDKKEQQRDEGNADVEREWQGNKEGEDDDDEGEDLRVDPQVQQQRRELLTSHIFSEDVTATLSRLLMIDYVVLSNVAWSGVWFKEIPTHPQRGTADVNVSSSSSSSNKETCSLLRSLLFPFPIPAALLRAPGSSPEVIGLAMVLLIAAGCCSAAAWRGCMDDDVAFDEVVSVIGLTQEEVTAAVRSLMLGEE